MKNILIKLSALALKSFEKIAIARTREALNHLPDYELDALGITRQQLKTGNFYSVNKVLGFKTKISNLETKMKDLENKKAA